MNRCATRATVFGALIAWSMSGAAHAEWTLVEEHFYALSLANNPCGRSSERVEIDGDRVRTVGRMEMRFRRAGQETVIDLSSEFIESVRGEPLEAIIRQKDAQTLRYVFEPMQRASSGQANDARTTVHVENGAAREDRIVAGDDWLTPREAAALVAARVKGDAKEIRYRALDVQSGLVVAAIAMTRADEPRAPLTVPLTVDGRAITTQRYAVSNSLVPIVAHECYDASGALVLSTTPLGIGDLVSLMTSKTAADESYARASFDLLAGTMVPSLLLDEEMTHARAEFEIALRESPNGATTNALSDLPEVGAQRVHRVDARRARVHVDTMVTSAASTEDETDPRWMASNNLIDFRSDAVQKLFAKAKLPRDASALQRAELLRALVARHLRDKNLATAFGSASEAALARGGDCTEHAVLLAALLRAAEIPSRVASGLVYVSDIGGVGGGGPGWGWHLWTQALVDPVPSVSERVAARDDTTSPTSPTSPASKTAPASTPAPASRHDHARVWIDLDATLSAQGARYHPGHIVVAVSDLAGGATDPAFSRALGLIGAISITPVRGGVVVGAKP